jgi:hypothetical protein
MPNSEVSVDAVNQGEAPPRRKHKWRNIQRLKEKYNTGVRNVDDYWAFDTTNLLNQDNKDKQLSQNILKTIVSDAVRGPSKI